MRYPIKFKESVSKDLKKISKAEIGRIFQKIFDELSTNPNANEELRGKFKGLRKLRVGEYRVIYVIKENEVLVSRVGHRKEVHD